MNKKSYDHMGYGEDDGTSCGWGGEITEDGFEDETPDEFAARVEREREEWKDE